MKVKILFTDNKVISYRIVLYHIVLYCNIGFTVSLKIKQDINGRNQRLALTLWALWLEKDKQNTYLYLKLLLRGFFSYTSLKNCHFGSDVSSRVGNLCPLVCKMGLNPERLSGS